MTDKTSKNSRGRTADGSPNPVDVHVGRRLCLLRKMQGLSQEKLGASIGMTFQQIQKYERGQNRIGASRLFDMSKVLGVSVGTFFEDMPEEVQDASPRNLLLGNGAEAITPAINREITEDIIYQPETVSLVRAYYNIPNREIAKEIVSFMRFIAKESGSEGGAE